jgi:hypothetical protein
MIRIWKSFKIKKPWVEITRAKKEFLLDSNIKFEVDVKNS